MITNPVFKVLAESTSAVRNNIEVNMVLNQISKIQESSTSTSFVPKYPVEMLPLFPITVNEHDMVLIEGFMLDLFCERNNVTEDVAINSIVEAMVSDGHDITAKNIAVLLPKQDVTQLHYSITHEASCIDEQLESINS